MEKGKNSLNLFSGLKAVKKMGKDQFVIFILVGILLIIIALPTEDSSKSDTNKSGISDLPSATMDKDDKDEIKNENEIWEGSSETEEYERYVENKLEKAITNMEGAGKVKVLVTVSASKEKIVEKDEPIVRSNTAEKDAEGGNRNISEIDSKEETVYIEESNGTSAPFVVKTLQPVIEGVVVIAQGGDKPIVNNNITESIVALFNIEPHKIKVVKMKSE